MKYLVTGGAGFIGSHLIEKLLNDNHSIVCVDDLSTGNKDYIPKVKNISFLNEKIQNVNLLKLPEDINGIFHLAAQASVPYSIDNFYKSSSNNLLSTMIVFEFAKNINVPIVYASSSAVYGNLPLGNDQKDQFDILSPYAQDKLTMEEYAKMCFNIYNTPSIGLRFFNVYGPRQDPNSPYSGVISIFIDRLLKGKNVIVNGGYQTRDFVFVKDIVDVLTLSMDKFKMDNLCSVFNVGTGISVSIDDLLLMLSNILNVQPTIILNDLPFGDPEKSSGKFKLLSEKLDIDINQFLSLYDGLTSTINYIKGE